MSPVDLYSIPEADVDLEIAFERYERIRPGFGHDFLTQLQATYSRISSGPLKYQIVDSGVRRALLRQFPYAVYFVVEVDRA